MYRVRNVSKQEIALGDLKIALRPGQEIDLDMICSRYIAEQSVSLKVFLKKSMLKIISKDTPGIIKHTKEIIVTEKPSNNEEILKELRDQEKRLIERQDLMIKKHLGEATKGLDPKAMEALQSAIAALQNIVVPTAAKVEAKPVEAQGPIGDKTAIEIQKRTLDRLSKNVSGKISHEESKSKSNVDSNIDELGDMLG